MNKFFQWIGGICIVVVLIAVPVFCYHQGVADGVEKGRKNERESWEDDARNQPHIHQTISSRFYKVERLKHTQ